VEVKQQQLSCPLVLRDNRQVLVEQELQAEVVCADEEWTPPQIRLPMPHRLDEPNQLMLVCHQLHVPWQDLPAEEGDNAVTLVKNGTKPGAGRITLNDEVLVER
jgi:hypothetical protein